MYESFSLSVHDKYYSVLKLKSTLFVACEDTGVMNLSYDLKNPNSFHRFLFSLSNK